MSQYTALIRSLWGGLSIYKKIHVGGPLCSLHQRGPPSRKNKGGGQTVAIRCCLSPLHCKTSSKYPICTKRQQPLFNKQTFVRSLSAQLRKCTYCLAIMLIFSTNSGKISALIHPLSSQNVCFLKPLMGSMLGRD